MSEIETPYQNHSKTGTFGDARYQRNPLDYTRIHPDEYATVRYFASIHEDEDNDLDEDDEDNDLDDEAGYRKKYKKLGEMMQNSEKTMNDSPEIFHPDRNNSDENEVKDQFSEIDIDDLEKQFLELEGVTEYKVAEGKLNSLNRLKRELRWPYACTMIRPFSEMHHIARFNRMTGETLGVTIGAGHNITGKITRILKPREEQINEQQRMGMPPLVPSRAFVSLRAGMRGVLFRTNVQDMTGAGFDMSAVVQENRRYVFRILALKKTPWGGEQFELSMKRSDVNADPRIHLSMDGMNNLDAGLPSWMHRVVTKQLPHMGFFEPKSTKLDKKENTTYVKRNIMHDEFKNLNGRKAEQFLSDKADGEIVFRPSRKGVEYLTVTIKLKDSIFLHVDIKDMTGDGQKLKIDETVYRSLDMIQSEYCATVALFAKSMFSYAKFVEGGKEAVEQELQNLYNENPKRRHYRMTYSTRGCFHLAYLQGTKVKFIPLQLTQNGYNFFDTFLNSPKDVERYFKKNYQKLAQLERDFKRKIATKNAQKLRQEQFQRMATMNNQFPASGGMMPQQMMYQQAPPRDMNYPPAIPSTGMPPLMGQQFPPGMPPGQQFPPGMPPSQQFQQFPPGMPPGQQFPPGMPPGQQFPPGMPPGQQFPPGMPPSNNRQQIPPGMPPGYRGGNY